MNSSAWLSNLAAWWLQTGTVTAMAAMLLRATPVRSPRAMLAYLQALLSLCLVLPALEPWRVASAAGLSFAQDELRYGGYNGVGRIERHHVRAVGHDYVFAIHCE